MNDLIGRLCVIGMPHEHEANGHIGRIVEVDDDDWASIYLVRLPDHDDIELRWHEFVVLAKDALDHIPA